MRGCPGGCEESGAAGMQALAGRIMAPKASRRSRAYQKIRQAQVFILIQLLLLDEHHTPCAFRRGLAGGRLARNRTRMHTELYETSSGDD